MADVSDMHEWPGLQPPKQERLDHFARLSPVEAVRAVIEGDFSMNEEAAVLAAIRRDPRVRADDHDVIEFLLEAIEIGAIPESTLEELAKLPVRVKAPGSSVRSEKAYKIPPGLIGKVGKRRR